MNYLSNVTALIQSKRGVIVDVKEEGDKATIMADQPVATTFDFTNELRSETEGRGSWSLVDEKFRRLPKELYDQVLKQIRQRKGLDTV